MTAQTYEMRLVTEEEEDAEEEEEAILGCERRTTNKAGRQTQARLKPLMMKAVFPPTPTGSYILLLRTTRI